MRASEQIAFIENALATLAENYLMLTPSDMSFSLRRLELRARAARESAMETEESAPPPPLWHPPSRPRHRGDMS